MGWLRRSIVEITNFGHFQPKTTTGIIFFENEEGHDWYDIRRGLTEWDERGGDFLNAIYGTWAMVSPDGVITNVEFDPSRLMPGDRTVLGIDAHHEDITPGMIYRDGVILPKPVPTPDKLRASFPELSPPRFWKAARQVGITKAGVIAQIEAIADEDLKADMLIDIEEATGFLRLNSTVVAMTAANGIPPEQLDALWLWAAGN
jgi:hypothetical protein